MWLMLQGKGGAGWDASGDDIARGEVYGDGATRLGWPLGGARVPDHVRRQRLEMDAAIRNEK